MGVLLITCAVTGKEFSTGLQIGQEEQSKLPDYETATFCLCKQLQRWRPKEARWVEALPPELWIENQ